jgi:hypothetical protein
MDQPEPVRVVRDAELLEADPAFTVHRESNPGREASLAVIARAGAGIPTVNVLHPPAPHA